MSTPGKHKQQLGPAVRVWLCIIALALVSPSIAGFFTDHDERSQWERRQLTSWQDVIDAGGSKLFFAKLDSFIGDHIGFATELNTFYRRTLFYLFRDAAVPNISVGEDGLVFLTGHTADKPYSALRKACMPSRRWTRKARISMRRFSQWFEDRGVRLTYAIVPSKPLIYGDRLPANLPLSIREACANIAIEDIFARRIVKSPERDGFRVFYPIESMRYMRDMEAFYPPGNFHADSAINHFFAGRLLRFMGIKPRREFREGGHITRTRSDLQALGFRREIDVWTYPYASYGISKEQRHPSWVMHLSPRTSDFATYTTATPDSGSRALILSNSFGSFIAPHLAPGFQSILHMNWNGVGIETRLTLLEVAMERFQPDEVIFLVHDAGMPVHGLMRLTEELPELPPPAQQ